MLDAWMNSCFEFFRGAKLAYDVLMPFYVKKVTTIDDPGDETGSSFGWAEFEALAMKLHRRELSGHAARDAINAAALAAPAEMWNEFYRPILLKDLRAGVTDSTINKVLEKLASAYPEAADYLVPVFGCQLAHDATNHEKKLRGVKMLDVKLNGVRLMTFIDKESRTVSQWTRNGKRNDSFPQITKALEPLIDFLPGSIVLDGEIMAQTFQELMTMVNRKTKKDTSDCKLALFDIVPLRDFKAGYCEMPQKDRHTALCALIPKLQSLSSDIMLHPELDDLDAGSDTDLFNAAYVIPKVTVDLDTPEGQATFAEFNRQALAAKLEGIMIKDPEAPYEAKRSVGWLKAKPFIEVSLEIVGFSNGKPGTKYANFIGAIFMYGREDDKHILVRVGGMSDEVRFDFAMRKEELLGFIGEVRADEITAPGEPKPMIERIRDVLKDENGKRLSIEEATAVAERINLSEETQLHSLRFPRWKGLRGTVRGEKL